MKCPVAFRILCQTLFVSNFLQRFVRTISSGLGLNRTQNFIFTLDIQYLQFVLITCVPTEIGTKTFQIQAWIFTALPVPKLIDVF